MKITKVYLKNQSGSCNFCDKSKLSESGTNLIYPYDYVYYISNDGKTGLSARICEDCLQELKKTEIF